MKRLPLLAADAPNRSAWLIVGGFLAAFVAQTVLGILVWAGFRLFRHPLGMVNLFAELIFSMVICVWSFALIQIWFQDPDFQTRKGVREVALYSTGVMVAGVVESLLLFPLAGIEARFRLFVGVIASVIAVGLVFRHSRRVGGPSE